MPAIVVTVGAVIAVLFVMVAFWRGVVGYLSESANWPELARRFPAEGRPAGRVFARQGGFFRGVAYQGILRVVPSASGFFVEVERPYAHRARPLLIPWAAFRELREHRSFLGWRYYELVLSEEDVFLLRGPAGSMVRQYFQGRHRVMPGRTLRFRGRP